MATRIDPCHVFLSRAQTRIALNLSLPTVDRLIRSGELQTVRVGKRVLVRKASLEKLGATKS